MLKQEKKEQLIAFGKQMLEMRERNQLTQMQLAEILDVDRRQISRYETGEAEMGALLYAKMQTELSIKVDDQLNELLQHWDALTPGQKELILGTVKEMASLNN